MKVVPAAVSSVLLSRYLEETEVRGGAEMDTITQAAAHASRRHPEIHNRSTGELRVFAHSHMEQRHDFLGASDPIRGRFLKAVSDY